MNTLLPPDMVLEGRFTPDQEQRYVHLPFTVPPGVRQLHVRYEYSDRIPSDPLLRGGNTLDIGLFDERGIASGSSGFRGWSGSVKLAFTVDERWATPPYRAGALGAGTWHVLLGPYKIGPRGLDYRVELWFNPGLPPEESPPSRAAGPRSELPAPVEPGWLRGDLHCHTLHSDGDSWPAEVLIAAAEAGLDFLGITDHNSAHAPTPPETVDGLPLLIPGIEVTTYGGHWNVWGLDRWFEFREPTREATARAMREAAALGGFVSVNHPKPFGPPWEYGDGLAYHAIEVWNGPWERLNSVALAHWDAHLRRGDRVLALGGSDTHHLKPSPPEPLPRPRLGQPTIWIRVAGPPTPAAILDGLRRGDAFISASPAGPQLYLSASHNDVRIRTAGAAGAALLLISDAGGVAASAIRGEDWETRVAFPAEAAYLRAQIVDPVGNVLAISNPIW